MADLTNDQITKGLTEGAQQAPVETQVKIFGSAYTAGNEQLVTLADVQQNNQLVLADYANLIQPLLVNRIFKTEMSNFIAKNPFDRFFRENSPWGRTKEHIVSIAGTIVNLTGSTGTETDDVVLSAAYTSTDENPSTLDWMNSKDLVYYTNHIRSFVSAISLNETEIKAAFTGVNQFNEYYNRKVSTAMERAKNIEANEVYLGLAKMALPNALQLLDDTQSVPKTTIPKITIMGTDFKQTDLAQKLRTYVNNIQFPQLAAQENPLGLPLITPKENLVSYITPDLMTGQDFLEAYAYTSTKVSLPTTTELMAPLPPISVTNAQVDTLGTAGITLNANGTYTGKLLIIAFIGDSDMMEVNRSVFYTDIERNKLREFVTPQVHDHFSVHPSYEKNVRFFAVPVK